MGARVTIKDVAKEAGVSVSTVSYALSRKGEPVKDSHKRVLAAVERLGYVPDAGARNLVLRRTNCIGLLVPRNGTKDSTAYNPFYADVIHTFSVAMSRRSCWMGIYMFSMEDGQLEDFLLNANVDGFIWLNLHGERQSLAIQSTNRRMLPHVGIYSYSAEDPSKILIDDVQSVNHIMHYLLDMGHRNILCMGTETNNIRVQEYSRVVTQAGLPYKQLLHGQYDEVVAYEAMREFLASGEPLPTAVFATNDSMAIGTMRAIKDAGLRVPDDISVIGYDDVRAARYTSPPLTTAKQNLDAIANAAIDYICQWRDKHEPGPGIDLRMPASLIVRESVASPRQNDAFL